MLMGEEPNLPYERPPLTKGYLLGQTKTTNLALRPQAHCTAHHIDAHHMSGCHERISTIGETR